MHCNDRVLSQVEQALESSNEGSPETKKPNGVQLLITSNETVSEGEFSSDSYCSEGLLDSHGAKQLYR